MHAAGPRCDDGDAVGAVGLRVKRSHLHVARSKRAHAPLFLFIPPPPFPLATRSAFASSFVMALSAANLGGRVLWARYHQAFRPRVAPLPQRPLPISDVSSSLHVARAPHRHRRRHHISPPQWLGQVWAKGHVHALHGRQRPPVFVAAVLCRRHQQQHGVAARLLRIVASLD